MKTFNEYLNIVCENEDKELDKIINSRLSASSQQMRKKLKSELKKLIAGASSNLGKWIEEKQSGIKEFLPEYWEAALAALIYHPESDYEPHQKIRMYHAIGSSFHENMRDPRMKYDPDED